MHTQFFIQFMELPFQYLQMDVPKTSFFSMPWFLAEERAQQPIRQNPCLCSAHTDCTDHNENVRTWRFFHRPCAQPRHNRPPWLFHRCREKFPCALALKIARSKNNWCIIDGSTRMTATVP